MSPVGNSHNVLASNNAMPVYECYWEPFAIDPTSAAPIVIPTVAGAGAWVPGALLAFLTAGVGAYPPLGFGQGTSSGGDSGSSGNPTFPNNWTVQEVGLAPASSTINVAGILLGVGAPGSPPPVVPNTIAGGAGAPALIAMVAKKGMVQVLVDNTTTIGHTIVPSTTSGHTGQCSDSGGTTRTYGTCVGVARQAVTVTAGPLPCWVSIDIP